MTGYSTYYKIYTIRSRNSSAPIYNLKSFKEVETGLVLSGGTAEKKVALKSAKKVWFSKRQYFTKGT